MPRQLTGFELAEFYAERRLPPSFSARQRQQVAATVLEILGLTAVRDEKIGDETTRGISGGQRKRVNIGVDMLHDPKLLFVDEPTSGLDSFQAQSVSTPHRTLGLSLQHTRTHAHTQHTHI